MKPRRTGDCIIKEFWFDDPAVITGGIVFAQMKGKHISSLCAAFCCEKMGIQPLY
jgi:hypothetical protein